MELHQLRYFVALADAGSFTRAAETCNVSQPSLSQQIHKLEEELQQPLVERLGRRIGLTDAGKTFLAHATVVLDEIEVTRKELMKLKNGGAGHLSLGVIPTVAPYLVPDVLKKFRAENPAVEITMVERFGRELETAAVAGELDLVLTSLPIEDERLEHVELFREVLLVVLPADHPASRRGEIRLEDIQEERFILLHEEHCLASTVEQFCSEKEFKPKLSCRSAQLATIQELVAAGLGVSMVPALASRADRSKKRIYRPLVGGGPKRAIVVAWHKRRYQAPIVSKLLDCLRREIGEMSDNGLIELIE